MKITIISWTLRLVVVVILAQTLYFKFSGAPESVFIFSALGIEPYGRIGSGIAELITAFLIILPKTKLIGVILGCFVMVGAIFSHIFVIGIVVKNDGGLLFSLALITFICCAGLVFLDRNKIQNLLKLKNLYAYTLYK
jgi:DoxX-like family